MLETIRYGLTNDFIKSLNESYKKDNNIKEVVAKLLDRFGNYNYPVLVENILKSMGFTLYSSKALQPNISAFIAVDDEIKKQFNTNRVVAVNKYDSVEHQRFAIAHEIAHWIFDCPNRSSFYSAYDTNESGDNPSEVRANKFAAELMMPTSDFIDYVNKQREEKLSNNEILNNVSKYFGAPKTAVAKRFIETKFGFLLENTLYEYELRG